MARYRQHNPAEDVLQAAVRRLRDIFDTFDSVAVCFSGGKDSLVVLHLARLVAAEYGINKLHVIFRDEELIPDSVIDFVDGYRQEPWVDMRWYAVPLQSSRLVLGTTLPYVQWDPAREWLRPKPPWAITLPEGDNRVFSQYTMDAFASAELPGKVCFLTGLRAAESLMRLRGVLGKLNKPHVCTAGGGGTRVMLGRPIYDWWEEDVFKFFYDQGISYCELYDRQLLGERQTRSQTLRVSTPLSSEPAKYLGTLRAIDPVFYGRLLRLFPGTDVMERYWSEYDRDAQAEEFGSSMEGIESWIRKEYEGSELLDKALAVLASAKASARTRPTDFTPAYLFAQFTRGAWKRGSILPNTDIQHK